MEDMTYGAPTGSKDMEGLLKDMSKAWLDRQKERHRWDQSQKQRQKKISNKIKGSVEDKADEGILEKSEILLKCH